MKLIKNIDFIIEKLNDLDNNFKIGIIKGITNTEYELKYIGSKKREQYRLEKISSSYQQ